MTDVIQALAARFGRGLPPLATLALILMTASPAGLPFILHAPPLVGLMAAFYWGIYRPWLMPAWVLFLLGLLQDVFSASPLGLHALLFLLARWLASAQRRTFKSDSFLVGWFGFALFGAGACLLAWVVQSLFAGAAAPPLGPFIQALVTVVGYPIAVWFFGLIDAHVQEED